MAVKPFIRVIKAVPFVQKAVGVFTFLRKKVSSWTPARLLYIALRDFTRSNGVGLAAGIAFYSLLSLFPLSLAAIAIAGYFYTGQDEQAQVVELIQKLIPVSTDYLADTIDGVVSNRGQVSIIGALGLLWAGLAVFSGLRKGINHAWGIGKPPNLLMERLIDLTLLSMVGVAASKKIVSLPCRTIHLVINRALNTFRTTPASELRCTATNPGISPTADPTPMHSPTSHGFSVAPPTSTPARLGPGIIKLRPLTIATSISPG